MKKGEIWFLELPFKDGREQRGTRPCLILANTTTDMIVVAPLTSNIQALRFPYAVEIKKSEKNGLSSDSIVLVFQVQSLDKRRFINRVGIVEDICLKKVEETIRAMLQL